MTDDATARGAGILDVDALRSLFESFSALTGTATALIDLGGKVLVAAGWQDICTRYHRVHPVTCARCVESDTVLAGQLSEGRQYAAYRCRNGLVDVAVPVVVDGRHVANLFTGQFLFDPPDLAFFRQQAVERGFDERAYLEALSRVPIVSEEQVEKAMDFLCRMAVVIGEMGLTRLTLSETNRELRASETRFRTLVDQAADAVFLHDAQNRIVDVNQQACESLGYTRDELLGMNVRDVECGYPDPEAMAAVHRRLHELGSVTVEGEHRRKDGTTFPVEVRLGRLVLPEQTLALALVRDVSERKQAEQERERLRERLAQAQKMESIGRLAGGVAHDFNNLLTAITGNAELALLDTNAGEDVHAALTEIHEAAARAASLTRQLLAFSRKQVIEPKVVDLNEVVRGLHSMLSRIIGEDVELHAVLRDGLDAIEADPSQVEQILVNLAANARDAMPEGGRLTVETDNVTLGHDYCQRHANATPGAHVLLAVSDTGCGMSQEVQSHLFEPFFTTKPVGGGTGLGLASVYGAVKQNGGSIEVYSEPGRGATFKLYFPRVAAEVEALPAASPTPSLPRGSETVLLVEDERPVRELAEKVLTRQGYTVVACANGPDALRAAEQFGGEVHLLLTDVVMPGMSGEALADALAASRPDAKVLFTSGYPRHAVVHHGVIDKGRHFLSKPYTPQALTDKVRHVLDG